MSLPAPALTRARRIFLTITHYRIHLWPTTQGATFSSGALMYPSIAISFASTLSPPTRTAYMLRRNGGRRTTKGRRPLDGLMGPTASIDGGSVHTIFTPTMVVRLTGFTSLIRAWSMNSMLVSVPTPRGSYRRPVLLQG